MEISFACVFCLLFFLHHTPISLSCFTAEIPHLASSVFLNCCFMGGGADSGARDMHICGFLTTSPYRTCWALDRTLDSGQEPCTI